MTSSTGSRKMAKSEDSKESVDLHRPPPEDVGGDRLRGHHDQEQLEGMGEVAPAPPPFPQMARQSSIYSLTLDEIQSAVCVPGKNFRSMNMDEFLDNIWSAEEGHASSAYPPPPFPPPTATSSGAGGATAVGLQRQSSLSVPTLLSRKTVDEVWSEIRPRQPLNHHQPQHFGVAVGDQYAAGCVSTPRQPTFGEMTLEDFLVKAGVVRDGCSPSPAIAQLGQHFAAPGNGVGVGYMGADRLAEDGAVYSLDSAPSYAVANGGFGVVMNNGYGSPRGSPTSSDGMVSGKMENSCELMEMGGGCSARAARKRAAEGAVEVVVERRQRRMIKNRESAARSRARKQAYTVELETELNQLKEENARLREEERRLLALRKQMLLDAMTQKAPNCAHRGGGGSSSSRIVRPLRRSCSSFW